MAMIEIRDEDLEWLKDILTGNITAILDFGFWLVVAVLAIVILAHFANDDEWL